MSKPRKINILTCLFLSLFMLILTLIVNDVFVLPIPLILMSMLVLDKYLLYHALVKEVD